MLCSVGYQSSEALFKAKVSPDSQSLCRHDGMLRGTEYESVIREETEGIAGLPICKTGLQVSEETPELAASPDGIASPSEDGVSPLLEARAPRRW